MIEENASRALVARPSSGFEPVAQLPVLGLQVSDGEIPQASKDIKDRLAKARSELDLEVHGLLVGSSHAKAAMKELVTHLHIFKSWDAVKGRQV